MLHFLKTAKTVGEDTDKTQSSILLKTKGGWMLGQNRCEGEKPG